MSKKGNIPVIFGMLGILFMAKDTQFDIHCSDSSNKKAIKIDNYKMIFIITQALCWYFKNNNLKYKSYFNKKVLITIMKAICLFWIIIDPVIQNCERL